MSAVMKLRGHSSTQMTNPTWPQLSGPWQHRQLQQKGTFIDNLGSNQQPWTNSSVDYSSYFLLCCVYATLAQFVPLQHLCLCYLIGLHLLCSCNACWLYNACSPHPFYSTVTLNVTVETGSLKIHENIKHCKLNSDIKRIHSPNVSIFFRLEV